MDIKEHEPLGPKTTMRIGGTARFYAEVHSQDDVEFAYRFATQHSIPLIVLGGGSNTIFANAEIDALVIRIKADGATWIDGTGQVRVQAGKILAVLVNEAADRGYDLSSMTGILGSVGGALFGNAGMGHGGIWIDRFVREVKAFKGGEWKTYTPEECHFSYRESGFKHNNEPVILWETLLEIPAGDTTAIKAEIDRLLKKRIETQPHIKTAGSCFKSLPDGTPAWKLIDAAGLRGLQVGGVQVAEKHANFLLNVGNATFEDALEITKRIKEKVPQIAAVEMRFYDPKGNIVA
jgi:UDP-N-acetylenolpyruvoylglucosamine reductase